MMVNKRPVLIYQTRLAPIRVIVTISDIHLRDALYSDTDDNGLALWVQNQMIARYGRWLRTHTRRYLPRPLAKQHDASALARGIYSAGRTYRLNYSPNPQPDGAGQRADETTL